MPTQISGWTRIFGDAYNDWFRHKAPRMGAALSYYTMFSLAPLLIVSIFIAGIFFGQEAARGQIFFQIRDLIGDQGALAIEGLIRSARRPSSGVLPGIIGLAALLFGATGVFTELRDALNTVWEVDPAAEDSGLMGFLRDRLFSFLMVLSIGFLLLVSLVLSAFLLAAGKFFGQVLPMPSLVLEGMNLLISFAVITLLFAAIYKLLPEVNIEWGDVWHGAAVSSLLFAIGKSAIGLYLGTSGVASTYGAAGSLVIVLVWVYYSAQIFFYGAEFTHAYATLRGSRSTNRSRTSADLAPRLQIAETDYRTRVG